jgi:superfamily II DNA/RNA helicase
VNITQGVVMFKASRKDREASEKRQVLRMLIDAEGEKCTNAIVFCNRKMDVDVVAKSLKKHGYDAAPIHGDLDQSQRTKTLDGFRAGTLRFLIASDVAARGLDVPSVSHVFNFDVPSHAEDYVHRIGRTGRAGRDGTAIMICTPRDEKNLADVERLVQNEIPRLSNPLGNDTAPEAPEETAKPERAKSTRTRSRSRSDKDAKPKADAAAPAPSENIQSETTQTETKQPEPKAAEAPVEAPKSDKRAEDKAAKPPKQDAKKDNNDRRGQDSNRGRDSNRGGRDNTRGGRNNNDRGGNKVVGLGDHTPEFIGLSFAERPDG